MKVKKFLMVMNNAHVETKVRFIDNRSLEDINVLPLKVALVSELSNMKVASCTINEFKSDESTLIKELTLYVK